MKTLSKNVSHALAIWYCLFLPHVSAARNVTITKTDNAIQAPFDSFVCFQTSYYNCIETVSGLYPGLRAALFTVTPLFYKYHLDIANGFNGTEIVSGGPKPQCRLTGVFYSQTFDPDAGAAVVFVSVPLVTKISDDISRLSILYTECRRLADQYQYDLEIQKRKGDQRKSDLEAELASKELQIAADIKTDTGQNAVTVGGRTMSLSVYAHSVRLDQLISAQNIEEEAIARRMGEEYSQKSRDLQIAIDNQVNVVIRGLYEMETSTVRSGIATRTAKTNYDTGAWVKRGTVVLSNSR